MSENSTKIKLLKTLVLVAGLVTAMLLFSITAYALETEKASVEPTIEAEISSNNETTTVSNGKTVGTIFEKVNWGDKIVSFIIAVFQAVIIAIITKMLLDKAFSSTRAVGRRLRNQGITKVSDSGRMSFAEKDKLFGLHCNSPVEIYLCFLTGCEFFNDFENSKRQYLSKIAKEGCEVNILLCNPNQCGTARLWGELVYSERSPIDIPKDVVKYYEERFNSRERFSSFIERQFALNKSPLIGNEPSFEDCHKMLEKTGDYYYEIQHVLHILRKAVENDEVRKHIHLRFYDDEFRSSFLIAKYKDPAIGEFAHTTLNAPVRVSTESVSITMEKGDGEQPAFFDDLDKTFTFLWDAYKETEVNWASIEQIQPSVNENR